MTSSPHAEFAQFRFVRDASGNVIVLPSQGIDERNLLVIDFERWGLARLHIFEEAAIRNDKLDAFQDEMGRIVDLRSNTLTRLVSWGRDGEELFYADEMLDGEPMPEYLGRTGGVPFPVAADWIVQLIRFLEDAPADLPSFERFSTLNFQVILDSRNQVRPVFSEFYGWTKPGAQVQEHTREWSLAQIFCSLMAGVPVRTFHNHSLPRNFDELESDIQSAVLDALSDGAPGAYENFKTRMQKLAETAAECQEDVAIPHLAVREWLRAELADAYTGEPEFELPEEFGPHDERYALSAIIRGTPSNVQLLPGPEYMPRDGWLNQHHLATRRLGRAMMHQLHVNFIEDRGPITLVGEEQIDGVDLGSLFREMGPLSEEQSLQVAKRVSAVLDALEGHVGGCAIWWLPPENILFHTGTRSIGGAKRFVERKGDLVWEELPVKLRLHQTTRTLRKGISLPAKVRALSQTPGKPFYETRRSAVALPLIFFLLSAERFRWRQPVQQQAELSKGVAQLLEGLRMELLHDPELVEKDLFREFEKLVNVGDGIRRGKVAEETTRADGLEALLEGVLYQGTIDLSEEPGNPKPPAEKAEITEDEVGTEQIN